MMNKEADAKNDENDEAETDSRNEVSEGIGGKGEENEGVNAKGEGFRMRPQVIFECVLDD